MKKKPYSFIRSCASYLPIAIFFCNLPNMCMAYVPEKTFHTMSFIYLYSICAFTVMALLFLRMTKISGIFDKGAAIFVLIGGFIGALVAILDFYNTILLLNDLRASGDIFYESKVALFRLWLLSIGLGVVLGLIVLSSGALLRPQEKRKVEELS